MNTLILIGPIGDKRAYLNTPKEEALEAYRTETSNDPPEHQIREIHFTKSFSVYDAWESQG